MSTHPNTILMVALKPDGLTRKTLRDILAEGDTRVEDDVKIGENYYHTLAMESGYDEGYQISGDEGDVIIFNMITYGYGRKIAWEELEAEKNVLEEWAKQICERHHCTYQIFVTANYW